MQQAADDEEEEEGGGMTSIDIATSKQKVSLMRMIRDDIKTKSIRGGLVGTIATPPSGTSARVIGIKGFIHKYDILALLIGSLGSLFLLPLVWNADVLDIIDLNSNVTPISAACSISVCSMLMIDVILDYIFIAHSRDSHLYLRFTSVFTLMCTSTIYLAATQYKHQLSLLVDVSGFLQMFIEFTLLFWLLKSLDTRGIFDLRRTCTFTILFFCFLFLGLMGSVFPKYPLSLYGLFFVAAFAFYYGLSIMIWLRKFHHDYYSRPKQHRSISINDAYTMIVMVSTTMVGLWFVCLVFLSPSQVFYTVGIHVMRTCLAVSICLLPGRMYRQRAIQLEYDAEVKTSLVSYMSHELLTPLSALSLGLEMLQTQIQVIQIPIPDVRDTVKELEICCAEATDIIDSLLLYEKIYTSKLTLHPDKVPVMSLLCEALQPFLRSIHGAGGTLAFLHQCDTLSLASICVNVDKERMLKQLMKIMNMAMDRITAGSHVDVEAYLTETPMFLDTSVIASSRIVPSSMITGVRLAITLPTHLSTEEREYFGRTKVEFVRDAKNGSGGLELTTFILRRIAALHGGRAGIIMGERDTIFIELPVVNDDAFADVSSSSLLAFQEASRQQLLRPIQSVRVAADEKESSPVVPVTPAVSTKASMRLLVVDDSDMNRKMILKVMQSLGHVCQEANDGNVAVEIMAEALAKHEEFEAVLLDNEMPVMRGRDAVRRMREMGYTGIVLGVTGNALEEDIRDFKENGADDVAIKPLTTAKFRAAMEALTTRKSGKL